MKFVEQCQTVRTAITGAICCQITHQLVTEDALQVPGAGGIEALVIECRRAGDNPIEVLWVALSRHERLTTALRATFKIRVLCIVSVVVSDQPFARHDAKVYRAIAKIDFSLTVVETERGAGLDAVIVSHIAVGDRVAFCYPVVRKVQISVLAAIAPLKKAPVPVIGQR